MKDFKNSHLTAVKRACEIMASRFNLKGYFAKDLYSRTLEKVCRSAYDESRDMFPYACKIAMNVALDILSEETKRQSLFSSFDKKNEDGEWEMACYVDGRTASCCDEASFHLEEVDCNNRWNDFLAGVNEADRTILTLLHEQVKTAEIAERLGKTQNYVSVRIHRLKKGARRALAA